MKLYRAPVIWPHDTLRMRGCVGVYVLHRMRLVRALSCG